MRSHHQIAVQPSRSSSSSAPADRLSRRTAGRSAARRAGRKVPAAELRCQLGLDRGDAYAFARPAAPPASRRRRPAGGPVTRPALEVADVFRRHGEAFRERFGPDPLPGRRARLPPTPAPASPPLAPASPAGDPAARMEASAAARSQLAAPPSRIRNRTSGRGPSRRASAGSIRLLQPPQEEMGGLSYSATRLARPVRKSGASARGHRRKTRAVGER